MTVATQTFRYIRKCHTCKQTFARDYERRITNEIDERTKERMYEMGRSWKPNYIYFRMVNGAERRLENDYKCPHCNTNRTTGDFVKAKKSDHKCDARCLNAKGPDCECSCGGENHGRNYLGI